jgi:hypothetical protein
MATAGAVIALEAMAEDDTTAESAAWPMMVAQAAVDRCAVEEDPR